jgi:hypothetical protein
VTVGTIHSDHWIDRGPVSDDPVCAEQSGSTPGSKTLGRGESSGYRTHPPHLNPYLGNLGQAPRIPAPERDLTEQSGQR